MATPLLLHVFSSFAIGGQQTRFATIANCLGRAFRHRLISLDGRDEAVTLLSPDLDVAVLPAPARSANPVRQLRAIARSGSAILPDLLITYNWGAIEWAIFNRLRYRRPHIHLEDGFGPDEADRQKRRRVLARRVALRRSTVVVPSRNLAEIARTQWGLNPSRVIYIPNGIDPGRFDRIPNQGEPHRDREDGECVIGSFSPLRREKNIERLIRAFAELSLFSPSVRLVICGDGPERAPLIDLASRLSVMDRVTFTGHVSRPELAMAGFDLFAITSDTEQMPYAVLEAMSARLPVVATAVGDIPIIVAEQNRPFIVERDAPGCLASALEQLCRDATLRQRIGSANREKVEAEFGIEPMVEAFRRLLINAIERR
jgi:glycosyltransferase involved in cell wall biosynthesis